MKRILSIAFIITFAISACTDNSKMIIGNWRFQKYEQHNLLSKIGAVDWMNELYEEVYKGERVEFRSDGTYSTEQGVIFYGLSGKFNLHDGGKTIITSDDTGLNIRTLEIISVSNTQLVVGDETATFTFVRE